MGLSELPVLPEDYPLFDWADWPDSKAALVQGGPTKAFEKACWNAIVESFTDAVEAAGLELYRAEEGLTPDHMKMLSGTYGRMTAERMNTLVQVIDDVIPLRWIWDYDRDFRGYIGRKAFLGSDREDGKPADVVYPEYFTELVKHINLVLELMRGTWPTAAGSAKVSSGASCSPGVTANKAVLIEHEVPVSTAIPAVTAVSHEALIAVPNTLDLQSTRLADVQAGIGAKIDRTIDIPLTVHAEGRSTPALPGEATVTVMRVTAQAEGVSNPPILFEKSVNTQTGRYADALAGEAHGLDVSETQVQTGITAEGRTGEAKEFSADLVSAATGIDAQARLGDPAIAEVEAHSGTAAEIGTESLESAQVEVSHKSAVRISCALGSAWYPPVWVNGGLWIRQVHNVTQNDKGELVIL